MEEMVTISKAEYDRLKRLDDDFQKQIDASLKDAQEGRLIRVV